MAESVLHAECEGRMGLTAVVEIFQWQVGEETSLGDSFPSVETIGKDSFRSERVLGSTTFGRRAPGGNGRGPQPGVVSN